MSYSYQWERCDAGGGSCVDIGGETNPTYLLVVGDEGKTIRCRVTDGVDTVTSDPTSVITAPPVGTAPAFTGPFYTLAGPWRKPLPGTVHAHALSPGMVQGVDVNGSDIHAFAYRPVEMQAKWGVNGLTYMKWAGPGGLESIIYAPIGAPTQTVWVDYPTFKNHSVQVPIPPGWTGYGQQSSQYFERRTSIMCENGDQWILYAPSPPGHPTANGGPSDGNWHAISANKVAGGWAAETVFDGGGGSGITMGPGLIVPTDIAYAAIHGDLGHTIALNTANSADGATAGIPKGVYPAGKGYAGAPEGPNTDGRTRGGAGIPHGARIFLDPTLSDGALAALGVTKTWQVWLAHTMQRYGLVSKETTSSQGDAGGLMAEFQESVDWNIAHGYYPAGFQWPWKADGSATSDHDYGDAFPAALMPTSNSHWRVWDYTLATSGINAP